MTETGEIVYQRTYSRTKPDGTKETWPETVERVVDGNLALVDPKHHLPNEREQLIKMMTELKIIPGGRHLWASGTKTQHNMNCWTSGFTDKPSDHFEFTFMRLMEGGGVGTNYSNHYLEHYPPVENELKVHIVCDTQHPDYGAMKDAGLLSDEFASDWVGAFEVEDSREGWAAALTDLIDSYYDPNLIHPDRVYDVSNVRKAGARLKTFGGTASGPAPLAKMLREVSDVFNERYVFADGFEYEYRDRLTGIDAMKIDHAIAQCVVAGGVRRSARMAMMHWKDPQIFDFIRCKSETGLHWTTNISVVVDDEFWHQVKQGEAWHARKLIREMAKGMLANGEPGMWDISLSNVGEPNEVSCTNPCGEITLEPWEPCNLGHVNLAAFAGDDSAFDLYHAHRLMTRFLIRATFSEVGDPKSREVLDRNRRIGLGHLGVASYLAMEYLKFSKAPRSWWFKSLLRSLAETVDAEAIKYSHDLRIPVPVKKRTIAPTGTISKLSGVSEGIHPIFARYFDRRIRFSSVSEDQMALVENYRKAGYAVEKDIYADNSLVVVIPTKDSLVQAVEDLGGSEDVVESAADLTLHQMLAFQAMYQEHWADNAVSFTANVDPKTYSEDDLIDLLITFGGRLKGSTIFPESSMPQAPYTRITKEEYEAKASGSVADSVDEECAQGGGCPIR